jgi:HK97 gp10 family phage protein
MQMPITDEFKEVQRVLTKLPVVMQRKVVVGGVRTAGNVIKKEAQKRVAVDTGMLKKSIAVRTAKKKDTKEGHVKFYIVPLTNVVINRRVKVGGQSAKLKAKVKSFHSHFLEFGTKNMEARPYLLPAAEATTNTAVKAFQEYVFKRTEKEVARLAR